MALCFLRLGRHHPGQCPGYRPVSQGLLQGDAQERRIQTQRSRPDFHRGRHHPQGLQIRPLPGHFLRLLVHVHAALRPAFHLHRSVGQLERHRQSRGRGIAEGRHYQARGVCRRGRPGQSRMDDQRRRRGHHHLRAFDHLHIRQVPTHQRHDCGHVHRLRRPAVVRNHDHGLAVPTGHFYLRRWRNGLQPQVQRVHRPDGSTGEEGPLHGLLQHPLCRRLGRGQFHRRPALRPPLRQDQTRRQVYG